MIRKKFLKFTLFLLFFFFQPSHAFCHVPFPNKVTYLFENEPIDVVIPCTLKDLNTLDLCIHGIRSNGKNIGRIIVVSSEKLTDSAEWFPECAFPFSMTDVAFCILQDPVAARNYLEAKNTRIGWIFQQLLKFYAPFVIPDISSNVLILDADTIFLNPVEFADEFGYPYFNVASEYHLPYFYHMDRLLKGLCKQYPDYSGITHHMLFQRPILDDLFELVEENHQLPMWEALCKCIDKSHLWGSCLSEYEIYFNFTLTRTEQSSIRKLEWTNSSDLSKIETYKKKGYHYVSFHDYMRK
jgi:hypothetical protein